MLHACFRPLLGSLILVMLMGAAFAANGTKIDIDGLVSKMEEVTLPSKYYSLENSPSYSEFQAPAPIQLETQSAATVNLECNDQKRMHCTPFLVILSLHDVAPFANITKKIPLDEHFTSLRAGDVTVFPLIYYDLFNVGKKVLLVRFSKADPPRSGYGSTSYLSMSLFLPPDFKRILQTKWAPCGPVDDEECCRDTLFSEDLNDDRQNDLQIVQNCQPRKCFDGKNDLICNGRRKIRRENFCWNPNLDGLGSCTSSRQQTTIAAVKSSTISDLSTAREHELPIIPAQSKELERKNYHAVTYYIAACAGMAIFLFIIIRRLRRRDSGT